MTGTGSLAFAYDALGRRVQMAAGSVSTNYVYDGLNGAEEQNSSGGVTGDMLGDGLDQWLTRTDSSGTNTMLSDGTNSTVGLVNSSGTLVTQFSYEPFGRTTFSGSGTSNLYRFAGRELDATGLYFMRARFYNPIIQHFLSPDFGSGDSSPYVYAHNSPMNFIDPLGSEAIGPFPSVGTGALIGLGSAGDPNLVGAPGFGGGGGSTASSGSGVGGDAGGGGGDLTGSDNSSADSSGSADDMGGSGGIPGVPNYLAHGNSAIGPTSEHDEAAAPAAFAGAVSIFSGGVMPAAATPTPNGNERFQGHINFIPPGSSIVVNPNGKLVVTYPHGLIVVFPRGASLRPHAGGGFVVVSPPGLGEPPQIGP